MSIKEAFHKGPMNRERELLTPELQLAHRNKVLEAGLAVHEEAHVPELLKQLADVIRPQFPDVRVTEVTVNGDLVRVGTGWNFRTIPDYFARTYKADVHDEVQVEASFLTKELVVKSRSEEELLSYEEWSTDPRVLEDAIVRASQYPGIAFDNPDRMFGR